MDSTYTFLREFAGSWMLIAMMMFYITACLWAISPRRRAANADAAQIPFRNETLADAPASADSGEDAPDRAHIPSAQQQESV